MPESSRGHEVEITVLAQCPSRVGGMTWKLRYLRAMPESSRKYDVEVTVLAQCPSRAKDMR